jgi:rhodanese-related sulfurtransferase
VERDIENGCSMRYLLTLLFALILSALVINSYAGEAEDSKKEVKQKEKKKEGPREVDAEEIWRGMDRKTEFALIDIRPSNDYDAEHIRDAVNLPLAELNDETLAELVHDKKEGVVFYCNDEKSMDVFLAATTADHLGYKKVYEYRQGLSDWKKRGFATTLSN